MARLVLLSEGLTGRSYELKVEKTTVGRVSDNAFEIPEASVSSHHCEILLQGKDVLVRDLNSTNGTFINGDKITEAILKPGQILRLGTIEMRLEAGDAAPGALKKQTLDQTKPIPQGVKLDELEGTRPMNFQGKTGFEKKSNKGTKIFIGISIVIAVLLVGLLVFLLTK
ncbi:MAG TPA: FHA domain-containing protein [Verrucomicrobiae bacterium]|jgi:pSer/pThr/pTyr-binding forkhead associated (FHA) protein